MYCCFWLGLYLKQCSFSCPGKNIRSQSAIIKVLDVKQRVTWLCVWPLYSIVEEVPEISLVIQKHSNKISFCGFLCQKQLKLQLILLAGPSESLVLVGRRVLHYELECRLTQWRQQEWAITIFQTWFCNRIWSPFAHPPLRLKAEVLTLPGGETEFSIFPYPFLNNLFM